MLVLVNTRVMPTPLPEKFGRFDPIEGALTKALRKDRGEEGNSDGPFKFYPAPIHDAPGANARSDEYKGVELKDMSDLGDSASARTSLSDTPPKETPKIWLRMVGIIFATAQPVSCVVGMIGATKLLQQSGEVKAAGFPVVFSQENFQKGQDGLWWLGLALMVSALEWLVAFIYVTLPRLHKQTALAYPEHTNMDRVRQLGFALSDLLTAWSLFHIAGASPSKSDLDSHAVAGAFGIDASVLSKVLPSDSHHPVDVDLEHVAAQLAFQVVRGSAADMDELLLIAAGLRLGVVLLQFVVSEGFNVCYILPFGRCGHEYSGTNEKWTEEDKKRQQKISVVDGENVYDDSNKPAEYDKNVIPKQLRVYRGPRLEAYENTTLEINRCCWGYGAAFWHNHLGAIRNWLYFSCLLFFFGVLVQHRSVTGTNDAYFWPQIWPDGTDTLLSAVKDAHAAAAKAAAENSSATTNTTHLEPLIQESGVFPRAFDQLNPNIDEDGDATQWAFMAAGLIFAAEFFRFFAGLAYLAGIVRNKSSVPGNHIAKGGVARHMWP